MAFPKISLFFVTSSNCCGFRKILYRSICSQSYNCNGALLKPIKSELNKVDTSKCSYQASMPLLNKQFVTFSRLYSNKSGDEDTGSKDNIEKLVKRNKCVVFMKGVPEQPICGFSNAVVQILRMHNVDYDAHNVLDDEALRAGIKTFSDWPTIPQIYINGEFIGGCDILLQMHQSGDLIDELKKVGIRSALLDEETDPKTK